ncbi:ABC transporter permease [Viridibacterium curvum]|uniref:ABC transporter permease n=1 Tax=Viridibacterium curvum TaxID=1101404 RepID=A0ABP9QMB8_9RHOO
MPMLTPLLRIAIASAWNRRGALLLTLASITLASLLLLGVSQVRQDVRERFSASVSGTDLIVGPRGSSLSLMLYAVFHMGEASQNMSWASAQWLEKHPAVRWTLPVSLGDSHKGFPVLATEARYFELFRYGDDATLRITQGAPFKGLFDVVLGAQVARELGYQPGSRLILTHGSDAIEGADHADKPFTVTGILAPTGTPADRTLFISLQAMEAIHLDWQGAPIAGMGAGQGATPGFRIPAEFAQKFDLQPKAVTGVLVGLKSRAQVFAMQRDIAARKDEALMGVLPGVALDELWELAGIGERALFFVLAAVAIVGLAGLVASLLASLDARRRELAILRSVGASARAILALLLIEGLLTTALGIVAGWLLLGLGWTLAGPWLLSHYGFAPAAFGFSAESSALAALIFGAGLVASLIPAVRAYLLSLADGLNPRL